MKILYGIAGTGNGHLSRSYFIYNLLTKYSDIVDVLISGDNYSLKPMIPITYYNKGLTFSVYNGKINYLKTLSNLDLFTNYIEQKKIDFKKYDLIITDFDPITAWASVRYRIPSIHISHQASFINNDVPRPKSKNILGEYIMKYFCPTNDYIGIHYQCYGDNISEPIIGKNMETLILEEKSHISVYLPWYEDDYLLSFFQKFNHLKFEIFSKHTKSITNYNNCVFFSIDKSNFLESIRSSYGVICNAGFQTSSEVLYLGKRLIVVPVEGQYEQICNVAALNKLGVQSMKELNDSSIDIINQWLCLDPIKINFKNNLALLLDKKINKLIN